MQGPLWESDCSSMVTYLIACSNKSGSSYYKKTVTLQVIVKDI